MKSIKNRKDNFRKNTIRKNKKRKKVSRKKRMRRVLKKKRMLSIKKRMQGGINGYFFEEVHNTWTRKYLTAYEEEDGFPTECGIFACIRNYSCLPFLTQNKAINVFTITGYFWLTGAICLFTSICLNVVDRLLLTVEYTLRALCDITEWGFEPFRRGAKHVVKMYNERNQKSFKRYLEDRTKLNGRTKEIISTLYDNIYDKIDSQKPPPSAYWMVPNHTNLINTKIKLNIQKDFKDCNLKDKNRWIMTYFKEYKSSYDKDFKAGLREQNEKLIEEVIKETIDNLENHFNRESVRNVGNTYIKDKLENKERPLIPFLGGASEKPNKKSPLINALNKHLVLIMNNLKDQLIEEINNLSKISTEEFHQKQKQIEESSNYLKKNINNIDETHLIHMIKMIDTNDSKEQLFLLYKDKLIELLEKFKPTNGTVQNFEFFKKINQENIKEENPLPQMTKLLKLRTKDQTIEDPMLKAVIETLTS
jgi:hypothetical protein